MDETGRGRSSTGITRTALTGAGQTYWHTPHPVHRSGTTFGRPLEISIAPSTGHRSAQTVQKEPVWARHWNGSIRAVPMR